MAQWRQTAISVRAAAQRRARSVRRFKAAVTDKGAYPRTHVAATYWWDDHANFGDALTPWLLQGSSIIPIHTPADRAELVVVGSILEMVPETYAGMIWGSGLMRDKPRRFDSARVLALRGHLTRGHIGRPDVKVLGDPGLLAADRQAAPATRWQLGLVPHVVHRRHPVYLDLARRYPNEVRVVDARAHPSRVLREIASCAAILSSSLHGLIVADSYGVPAAWMSLTPGLQGGDFKFHDYESVIHPDHARHVDVRPGEALSSILLKLRPAHSDLVATSVVGLNDSLNRVRAALPRHASPLSAWRNRP